MISASDRGSRLRTSAARAAEDGWLLVGLLALGVVLPLIVSVAAGSLEIPRNDDWTYRRIALELARTGQLALEGASRPTIVGQILFVQPFLWLSGLQPWAFTAAAIVFAIGAIVSAYVMVRQILPARLAVIPVLLLALFPGYLAYATSFMSDVPALAATFACLALGAMALKRRPVPTGLLVAAVAIGFFAFSIRDFAVAAPASVVLAAICAEPHRRRHWAVGMAFGASCTAFYLWQSSLPGQFGDAPVYANGLSRLILTLFSASLVIVPAAIIAAARWRYHWRRFDLLVGAEVGLLLVGLRVVQWLTGGSMPPILLDNLMTPWGVPAPNVVAGGRALLLPDLVWVAINVLALAAVVITFAVAAGIAGVHLRRSERSVRGVVRRIGTPQGVLFVFIVTTAAGLAAYGLRYSLFDRYLWTVVPTLATLLLYVPADLVEPVATDDGSRRTAGLSGAALVSGAVLAGMSILFLFNSHVFDVGRWRAGEALVRLGIAPGEIDAGYEWMGYHATSDATTPKAGSEPRSYRGLWPSFRLCGLASGSPQAPAGAEPVGTTEYQLNLFVGPTETLYLYRIAGPGCEPAAD